MRRDYRLYELHNDEFEGLAVRLCIKLLGEGVTPFAEGPDGGRDGKFHGTALLLPSATEPFKGHFVIQAKHVSAVDKSCSDRDFVASMKKTECPKIKRLVGEGICDHYLLFTNRKYTGGADEALMKLIHAQGVKSATIFGTERLALALDDDHDIRTSLPNHLDSVPFRFEPDELVEVIGAIYDYADDAISDSNNGATDFEKLKIDVKNKLNGVSEGYYKHIIVDSSMPHFGKVDSFLKNPRNAEFAELYFDAANELKLKIFTKRADFGSFDDIFTFLYEEIQRSRTSLRGRRRLISVLLHHMYCNCDIGIKHVVSTSEQVIHADA